MPKFTCSDNSLTKYALACGYKQTAYSHGVALELIERHGVYHVIATMEDTPELNYNVVFRLMSDAKSFYNKQCSKFKLVRRRNGLASGRAGRG